MCPAEAPYWDSATQTCKACEASLGGTLWNGKKCTNECPTENFDFSSGTCKCKAGLLLLPDQKDCAAQLAYAVKKTTQFECEDNLVYDSATKTCGPDVGLGKTWADYQKPCTKAGRVVSLSGLTCDEACPDYQFNDSGRCACGPHMARSGDECECLTGNFQLDETGKQSCLCKAGLLLLPDESDCVAELLYAEKLDAKFRCKQGLEYDSVSASCSTLDWMQFMDYCNVEGRVVNLAGTSCDASCPDYQ